MPSVLPDEIHHATLVRAPIERVYDAIATPNGLDSWFTAGSTVEARPGGQIVFRWKEWGVWRYTGEDGGTVLEATRPSRFVFQWHPDRAGAPTTVELTFEQRDDGTVVVLREHGNEDTPTGRKAQLDCATGWGEALTLLKFHVEHGVTY